MNMQERINRFLDGLDKGEYWGQPLAEVDEGMAAILIANLLVDHGIAPGGVLRCLKEEGIGDDPKLLAAFRDKARREELLAALQRL